MDVAARRTAPDGLVSPLWQAGWLAGDIVPEGDRRGAVGKRLVQGVMGV